MSGRSSPNNSAPTTPPSVQKRVSSNRRKSIIAENSQSIKVICRFRPVKQIEVERYGQEAAMMSTNYKIDEERGTVEAQVDYDRKNFTFDRIFGENATQSQLFDSVHGMVDSVMEGFNGTILAYGQTSSGKTHTMEGPTLRDMDLQGVIPRMVDELFTAISNQDENISFTLSVSYFEVYCERIRDLLNPTNDNLKIRENRSGFTIQDITEVNIVDRDGIIDAIETGKSYRASAATLMNAESSRSHSILSILVNQQNTASGRQRQGKIFLVDLAGSEKISKTGAQGLRLEEAKNINKSLTALGMVINALCDGSPHVPYRDSKLTRILQDSLGGNSKTTLIICCAPESRHGQETISTLRFGERAKRIKNNAKINEEMGIPELKQALNMAKLEIEQLSNKLKQHENGTISAVPFPSSANDLSLTVKIEESDVVVDDEKEEVEARARENELRIVELTELLEAAEQLLKKEKEDKMLVIAESEALKLSIKTLEEKLVEVETELTTTAPSVSIDGGQNNADLTVDLSATMSSDDFENSNDEDQYNNINKIQEESFQLQASMSSEIEALENSLISKERETKSAKASAAEYADKYAQLKNEHDTQIQRLIEKLAHEQHVRIDTEDKLESVQQQLWALQPTKGEGLFGKFMKGLDATPKKMTRRERDLTVEIEDLNSKIFQLNAAIETTNVSHRIVIETKENVTRNLLQKNVVLTQERGTLLSRVEDLSKTVDHLTTLLRDMQHRQRQSSGDGDRRRTDHCATNHVGFSSTLSASLRGGHGNIINSSVAIKGGGGRKSDKQ